MTYQDQIDNIMDTFEFARVAKMMKADGWKWHGDAETPCESEIRALARKHLRAVVDTGDCSVDSGGLRAVNEDGHLNLYWGISSCVYTDGCWLKDGEE
jgi:hypothetical protein